MIKVSGGLLLFGFAAAMLINKKGDNGMYKARGIRNNNPLNIRYNPANDWQGQTGQDKDGFAIFSTPLYGIRAAAKIVDSYRRRGIVTLSQIIETWAPPIENNTTSYIVSVAQNTGLSPDHVVSNEDYANLFYHMIFHENGMQPYTEQTIIDGVNLA